MAHGVSALEAAGARGHGSAMMLASFIYHDVVEPGRSKASGFADAAAAAYKLDDAHFGEHIDSLLHPGTHQFSSTFDPDSLIRDARARDRRVLLTFDDGGTSALTHIADRLERAGLKGLFFIATDFIGTQGFLDEHGISELHRRGHGIGTHSASHPARISTLPPADIVREWAMSAARLAEITGDAVKVASVPGGFYGPRVATAASDAGIRVLFTSEPAERPARVSNCIVIGRYSVKRSTPAAEIGAIASGDRATILRQRLTWNTKKVLKACGGTLWLALRNRYFERREANRGPAR